VLPRVVRHRRHRFPARDRVVKVRYDDHELAVLAAAADRAGLTVAGFLAGAGLSVAGQGPPPSQAADRELLAELVQAAAGDPPVRGQRQPGRRRAAQHRRGPGVALAGSGGRGPGCRERGRRDSQGRGPARLKRAG
jgi:hypothetical protein